MRDIKNFENYCITEDGRVWSKPRKKRFISKWGTPGILNLGGHWRKLHNVLGYDHINLIDEFDNIKRFQVHRLVAEAYIPNPNNLPEVNHKDGNRANNNVSNLEWCTRSENALHSTRVLKKGIRAENGLAKLNDNQVAEIRQKFIPRKYSQRKLAKEYGVSQRAIWNILHNVSWNDKLK